MRTIVVNGGNLYRIAMLELGDVTQWVRIAQLNNLSDPFLPGTLMTLSIPLPLSAPFGGIRSSAL